jgi:hypothetical protein
VLVYERGEHDRLLPLLDTLLRLRVAVHLLQLPSASQPEDEIALLGWGRAQGVFTYAGSAQEQWTAMLSAQPAPPLRFCMLLLTSLADVARQLQQPDCYTIQPGPRCVWAQSTPPGAPQPAAPAASLRRLTTLASRTELAGVMGVITSGSTLTSSEEAGHAGAESHKAAGHAGAGHGAAGRVAQRPGGAREEGEERRGAEEGEGYALEGAGVAAASSTVTAASSEMESPASSISASSSISSSISLLRLLDCMRRAQRLPLVLLPSSFLSLQLSQQLSRLLDHPGRQPRTHGGATERDRGAMADGDGDGAALLAAAVQWEAAVLRRANLVLAPSPHEAAWLATVLRGTRVLVRPPIAAAQPTAPPPLASRGGALVVADHDVGWEGVLWLVARVWPRLTPAPHLKLLGRGWRGWVDDAGGAGEAGGGEEHAELVALLRALQRGGGLTLLDAADAESAAAWRALDRAAVLLLPQQQNETGHAAPSWGEPSAAVSAMCRGLPMVSTPAARPPGTERCGMSAVVEAAAFAAAIEDAATSEGWRRRSADARACARAHLSPASVELEWGTHLQRALSAAGETQTVQ